MPPLHSLLLNSLLLIYAAMLGVVLFRLFNGRINLRGMLGSGDTAIDPERVQLLIVWLAGVATYAAKALATLHSAQPQLPDVPQELIALTAASQGIYLVGKYTRNRRK
ncbi:hypothetical protein [Chitinimonas sp.]|uniref:hypothetical protein n=1 Tax=Chitinimonas sp. TaxID=1934313 RepID=UPI002F95DE64